MVKRLGVPRLPAVLLLGLETLLTLATGRPVAAQQWRGLIPPPRMGHAVCHAPGGAVIMFGGSNSLSSTANLTDTWILEDSLWRRPDGIGNPPPRFGHSMCYDWWRDRVVLFGGTSGSRLLLGDTWEFDGRDWHPATTAASPGPSARTGAAMAFDLTRGRTVLFGGRSGLPTAIADTWVFDGTRWRALHTVVSPGPRTDALMAYDVVRDQMVLFGGGASTETWRLLEAGWAEVPTQVAPPARTSLSASMCFDWSTLQVRTIGAPDPDTLWSFDGSWHSTTTTSVVAQDTARIEFDRNTHRLVRVAGGPMAGPNTGATTALVGASWSQLRPQVPIAPIAMAYDAARERFVAVGLDPQANLATLEGVEDTWTVFPGPGPSVQTGVAMVYDTRRRRMVLFGGHAPPSFPSDVTWEFDGIGWRRPVLDRRSPPPVPRHQHSMVYDSRRHRVVLFGGSGPGHVLADTWEFDGDAWRPVAIAGAAPTARRLHAMGFDPVRGSTLLQGGIGPIEVGVLGDTWEFDGSAWRELPAAGGPTVYRHSMVFDAALARLMMSGGTRFQSGWKDDLWSFDGGTWNRRIDAPVPISVVPLLSGERERALAFDPRRGQVVQLGTVAAFVAPAPTPTARPLGAGCAAAGVTVPVLETAVPDAGPSLGTTLTLHLRDLPAAAGVLGLALGGGLHAWRGHPLPLPIDGPSPTCALWVPADLRWTQAHGGGTATLLLSIPALPELTGRVFGLQAAALDPNAPFGIAAITNALALRPY
ncbi:MAG: kelch repeat-containing protein [Planctomycetota bacterium]